jgi:pyocin large subunit-like protein
MQLYNLERMMKVIGLFGAHVGVALALCACQGKTSAVASSGTRGAFGATSASDASYGGDQARAGDPRDLPVPQIDGKPMWAANRKHTAEENAEYQFGKNGGDFGAKSETDYVSKAHAFIEKPPRDLETLDRTNGDKLEYDAKGNTFLVVARNGAPRTMFKPRDGAAYWAQQKDREAKRSKTGQDSGSDQG